MAKVRSPSYPSIGLKEAIDKVANIYEQNYQAPVPRAVAAELMGYGGLNGKSLGVLAALSKYGLLEGRGDDTRVSDLALRIVVHEPGTSERSEAIRVAAAKPELFAEIDGRFAGGKASDAALRSWLLTQKFTQPAADAVIRAYRETKSLVSMETTGLESAPVVQEAEKPMQARNEQMPSTTVLTTNVVAGWSEPPMDDPYEVAISGNSKTGKKIQGRFSFRDQQSVEELISVLSAMKPQLPKKADDDKGSDEGENLDDLLS